MNVSNEAAREWGWQPLGLAELQAVQGGSPTLPLPPPGASLSFFVYPTPTPWIPQVLSPVPGPW
jgi:hypothetical protein